MILCLLWECGFDNSETCMFVQGDNHELCDNWKKVKSKCPTAGKQVKPNNKHSYIIGDHPYSKEETTKIINEYKCNH